MKKRRRMNETPQNLDRLRSGSFDRCDAHGLCNPKHPGAGGSENGESRAGGNPRGDRHLRRSGSRKAAGSVSRSGARGARGNSRETGQEGEKGNGSRPLPERPSGFRKTAGGNADRGGPGEAFGPPAAAGGGEKGRSIRARSSRRRSGVGRADPAGDPPGRAGDEAGPKAAGNPTKAVGPADCQKQPVRNGGPGESERGKGGFGGTPRDRGRFGGPEGEGGCVRTGCDEGEKGAIGHHSLRRPPG